MPDLHDWITRQVDETEHGARAAAELQALDWSCPSTGVVDLGADLLGTGDRDVAYHVVRHDPAAVLRRCEADRKILAAHPYTTTVINPLDGSRNAGFGCETCHDWDGVPEGRGNCSTLLALAEGYGLTKEQPGA
jgi:hypothetical protein